MMEITYEQGNRDYLSRYSVCSACGRVHTYHGSPRDGSPVRSCCRPLNLIPFTSGNLCQGHVWVINDEDLLADIIAKLFIGKQLHVEKIITGITTRALNYRNNVINDAISKLTLKDPNYPYHRDGLIFQMFSWIAACSVKGENSILRAPHLVEAQKGFDGLQINVIDGQVKDIIIFEDKATEEPRDTIRDKVWPEFRQFYEGQRESELQQEVTTMLSMKASEVNDVEDAIETIFWEQSRKFRVAITANENHLSDKGKAALFKDYDDVIPNSNVDYRNAECVHIPELRKWMQRFSEKVINKLNTYRESNDV